MKSLRKPHQKPQHPSLHEQIEALEEAMNATKDAATFYRLLQDRSKLLTHAQVEHGHERDTSSARDEQSAISESEDEGAGEGGPDSAESHTGHCSAKTNEIFVAKAISDSRSAGSIEGLEGHRG